MNSDVLTTSVDKTKHTNVIRQAAESLDGIELTRRMGSVLNLKGLAIEATGPMSSLGELCAVVPPDFKIPFEFSLSSFFHRKKIASTDHKPRERGFTLAEVVSIHGSTVTLVPFGNTDGLVAGSIVIALGHQAQIGVGASLLGRIIDGFGEPIDGKPRPNIYEWRPIKSAPSNPMRRPRIDTILETGVRSIDGLLTLGRGQRVGIFAGSGVGKSTLLGMLARHVQADVNVIALIGERGREVREFIDTQLGPEGLKRSIIIVATADQPALSRLRAAHAALAIAGYFRDQGKQVLLTMDSITRFAMARREVGLAAGEPPTARGYTPSVFAELPQLCERCGTSPTGGAITALFTVLVEGDDLNEPISDSLRAILDGHIVLSRQLAHQGQYPAIDLLKSVSRLLPDLANKDERALARDANRVMALLERNRQMVELGAYERGSNIELDAALACNELLQQWLRQDGAGESRSTAIQKLKQWHQAFQAAVTRPAQSPVASNSMASPAQDRTAPQIRGTPTSPSTAAASRQTAQSAPGAVGVSRRGAL